MADHRKSRVAKYWIFREFRAYSGSAILLCTSSATYKSTVWRDFLEPKEGTKGGRNKSAIVICSKRSGTGKNWPTYDTVFSLVMRFFAKTGFCPRSGIQPLQMSTQPHCCRPLKPNHSYYAGWGNLRAHFRLQAPALAKNRITRENTVLTNS